MNKKLFLILLLILPVFFYSQSSAGSNQKTISVVVAGFVNLNPEFTNDINTNITYSLIQLLSKFPDFTVASFADTEAKAIQSGFRTNNILDEAAADIGFMLKADLVVTGDYSINADRIITINVCFYDTSNGKKILKRQYTGNFDKDYSKMIDNLLQRTLSLLLTRNISIGKLKVDIEPMNIDYALYFNDIRQKTINKKNGFDEYVISTGSNMVSIRSIDNGIEKEIYSEPATLVCGEPYSISYAPNIPLQVKNQQDAKTASSQELPEIKYDYPLKYFGYTSFILGAGAFASGALFSYSSHKASSNSTIALGNYYLEPSMDNYKIYAKFYDESKNYALFSYISYGTSLLFLGSGIYETFYRIEQKEENNTTSLIVLPNQIVIAQQF